MSLDLLLLLLLDPTSDSKVTRIAEGRNPSASIKAQITATAVALGSVCRDEGDARSELERLVTTNPALASVPLISEFRAHIRDNQGTFLLIG